MASCHVLSIVIVSLALISCSHGIGIESIRIDEKTATYISISWDIDAGSSWDYYSVDIIRTSGKSLNGYPINTTDMSHQMTGLKPEEYYEITVTPWNSEGAGGSMNTTLTTEAIPEGEILVSGVTSSSVFIQWRPVTGVFAYEIEAEPSDAIEGTGGIFEAEVGLTILLPGTVFNVTVRGGSPAMDLASTQIRSVPESPVNITLERIGSTEATLSWTPPTSPHNAYEFYVIINSTNERSLFETIQTEDVNGYEFKVTGLSRDALYVFEVGTVLDASDSFSLQRSDQNDNPSVFGRTEAIDDGEILVSNVTSSSAFIQWKPKEGVSSYTIVAEPSGAIEPLEGISDTEIELTILLRGTVFNVTVRGGDPAMDLASTQIRSAPEAPLEIMMVYITNDTVKFTFTPPTCPHDGYELYLSNSTTNQKSLVRSVPREDEMSYERMITELSPATIYNIEVGTILNAEGVFPLQRSEDNAMMTFETDDAVSNSPKNVMLLISLLAAVIMI